MKSFAFIIPLTLLLGILAVFYFWSSLVSSIDGENLKSEISLGQKFVFNYRDLRLFKKMEDELYAEVLSCPLDSLIWNKNVLICYACNHYYVIDQKERKDPERYKDRVAIDSAYSGVNFLCIPKYCKAMSGFDVRDTFVEN